MCFPAINLALRHLTYEIGRLGPGFRLVPHREDLRLHKSTLPEPSLGFGWDSHAGWISFRWARHNALAFRCERMKAMRAKRASFVRSTAAAPCSASSRNTDRDEVFCRDHPRSWAVSTACSRSPRRSGDGCPDRTGHAFTRRSDHCEPRAPRPRAPAPR